MGYYGAPFWYDSYLGESVKPFILFLPVVVTPVLLIFNFYPREVLRRVYRESIELELEKLKLTLNDTSSASEKRSYLLQFDKMCRDELRYSLQLTLNDLPIGITILVMVLQPLLKR